MVTDIYNKLAEQYDDDVFGIFESTRVLIAQQLKEHLPNQIGSAVDFAIGTGNALLELTEYRNIDKLYGNDISPKMLEIAQNKFGSKLKVFCDDLANIRSHLSDESQDLVLCHYVFSYCELEPTLTSAYQVLRPGGYCSIVTTTKKNFSELFTEHFPKSAKLLNISKWLGKVSTPDDHDDLLKRIKKCGFDLVDEKNLRKIVLFESYADVRKWTYNSGWVATYFEKYTWAKYFVTRVYFAFSRVIFYPLYPVQVSTDISVVLVKKP